MKRILDDIKGTLHKSAAVSQELDKQLVDLRRQLDEQKKQSPMDKSKETFGRQRKQLDCKFDNKTLQRLQKKRLETRSEGTCRWIFETKPYKNWMDSSRSELLLIHGGGNMGKSVLVSSVIESLEERSAKQEDVITVFFFCKNGDDYAQLTDRIFRQVLHALYTNAERGSLETLDKCNEAVKHFLVGYETVDGKGMEKNKDDDRAITFDEAFRVVAATLKKKVFLVIDALDECVDREERGFISTIRKLTRTNFQVNEIAQNDGDAQAADGSQLMDDTPIKVFISGRPEADILYGFQDNRLGNASRKIEEINIETENHADILNVVQAGLTSIPDLSTAERVEACKEIVRKANSSFGYVRPALETFQKPWQRPIGNHLKNLPNDPLDMNARIFARIDPSYIGFLKTCLTWAILAHGNQMVKIEEVVDAYSRVYLLGDLDWKRPENLDDHTEFYRSQLQIAGGTLLEVNKNTREISLIKPAIVKDSFLQESVREQEGAVQQIACEVCRSKAEASEGFRLTEREGHFQIARTIRKWQISNIGRHCSGLTKDQVQHLNSPMFQRTYILGDNYDYESSADESEPSSRRDDNLTYASASTVNCNEHPIDDDQVRSNPNRTSTEQEERPTGLGNNNDGTDADDRILVTEGSIEASNELDKTSRRENGRVPDHISVDQQPPNEIEDGHLDDDAESDVDSDFQERNYSALGDTEEDGKTIARYEISQFVYHLQMVEKLWKDRDKPDDWDELWNDAINFLETTAFRKCIAEELITQEWYFVVEPGDLTPLQFVAGVGLAELTRRLLEKGVDSLVRTMRGDHALHFGACLNPEYNQLEICRMLLDKGANPNNDAETDSSPFLWMLFAFPNVEATKLFFEYKAIATEKDEWGLNSLHSIAYRGTDPAMVQLLVEHDADINGEDEKGETPLHKLVRRDECSMELLEAFLKAGALVNKADARSQQPLYEASGIGNIEITKVLLRHGADVHDKDDAGWTALHNAAFNGHARVVMLLMDHGADPAIGDNNLCTPFYLACAHGDIDTIRCITHWLLDKGPSVIDRPCNNGRTPLRKACARGNLEAARLLLEARGDRSITLNINVQDSQLGRSALHAAAYLGHQAVVELLLSHHASADLQDKQGKTPLQLAYVKWAEKAENDMANQSYQDVILQLIATSRHAAVADTELLRIAVTKGCVFILKALLYGKPGEPRADPHAYDENGWTALAHAKQHRKKDVELLLLSHDRVFGLRPSRWHSTNEKKVVVSEDGLEIWQAPGTADTFEGNQLRHSLFSDYPIPSGVDRYYYEITLEAQEGAEPDTRPDIAFGVSPYRPGEKVRRGWIPGAYKSGINSWGYHADDGACCQPDNIRINEDTAQEKR